METVLARYPDLANELRPILKASAMAKSMAVAAPSPDVVRRGRAKLLQHASEMREAKAAPRKRMIPIFQRLAIALTLATLFLASGTGLVGASSTALPGENLYPVKRTWEDMRLFFAFNPEHKELLESEFESERLDEVDELLAEGRDEKIQYSGIFKQVNGVMYVSGVKVLVPDNLQVPADGAAVIIVGRTNAQGFVEIESIIVLPEGAVVPIGKPVEVENESEGSSENGANSNSNSNSNSGSGSEEGTNSGSDNESDGGAVSPPPEADERSFEIKGTVESISNNKLIVNGQSVYLDNAKIDGVLTSGARVEIKGFYDTDGRFIVIELKVRDSGSGDGNENSSSSSGSNSNEDSGSNSNDDSNSNDNSRSNDNSNSNDNSGSGGGGDNSNDSNNND